MRVATMWPLWAVVVIYACSLTALAIAVARGDRGSAPRVALAGRFEGEWTIDPSSLAAARKMSVDRERLTIRIDDRRFLVGDAEGPLLLPDDQTVLATGALRWGDGEEIGYELLFGGSPVFQFVYTDEPPESHGGLRTFDMWLDAATGGFGPRPESDNLMIRVGLVWLTYVRNRSPGA